MTARKSSACWILSSPAVEPLSHRHSKPTVGHRHSDLCAHLRGAGRRPDSLHTVVCILHNEPGLDQRYPHRLTVHTHPTADCSHRDARSSEAQGVCFLVDAQPRSAARDVAAAKVGEHSRAVDAVPFGESLHAHPGKVVADQCVHFGGGEESLSRLDSPNNRAAIVPRSGILGMSRYLVDPTV